MDERKEQEKKEWINYVAPFCPLDRVPGTVFPYLLKKPKAFRFLKCAYCVNLDICADTTHSYIYLSGKEAVLCVYVHVRTLRRPVRAFLPMDDHLLSWFFQDLPFWTFSYFFCLIKHHKLQWLFQQTLLSSSSISPCFLQNFDQFDSVNPVLLAPE